MTDLDELGKLDLLRDRLDISYEAAKEALDRHNGDVVQALIATERAEKPGHGRLQLRAGELADRVKELLCKGNMTKIRVKQADKVVLDLPVTAGVVGAVLAPELVILGTFAALFSRCTVEVERVPAKIAD